MTRENVGIFDRPSVSDRVVEQKRPFFGVDKERYSAHYHQLLSLSPEERLAYLRTIATEVSDDILSALKENFLEGSGIANQDAFFALRRRRNNPPKFGMRGDSSR